MRLALLALLSAFATALVLAHGADRADELALAAAAAHRPPPVARPLAVPTPTAAPIPTVAPVAPPHTVPVAAEPPPVAPVTEPAPAARTATPSPTPTATPTPEASKVEHVFVIALEGPGYQQAFGPGSPATYLGGLRAQGALLSGFAPLDGAPLPNYLAFAGGREPGAATRAGCPDFTEDCIAPNTELSLGDQVSSSGGTWRAYIEGLGPTSCAHPAIGTPDDTAYTRRNPWVYFHSLLDLGDCQADDLDLSNLDADLASARTTPSLAYLAPTACADLACEDAFLATWVPKLLVAPAYPRSAVVIAFLAGAPAGTATGALVLSPFATPGSLYAKPYDPYGLLRSVEDLLALKPLGKAAGAPSFARPVLKPAFTGAGRPDPGE